MLVRAIMSRRDSPSRLQKLKNDHGAIAQQIDEQLLW